MRRYALRDLRADEGLSLVETVVSLVVFALIMSGLAAAMAAFAHSTSLTRARATATTLAQQYTEKARAIGSTLLENCSNQSPTPPSTAQYRGDGINHTVATGTDSYCLPYQKTVSQDGITFTLTRLVLGKASANDIAGQLQSEKYLVVQVSWPSGGGGTKTYELDTIFTQKGSIAAAPAQGIRFLIKDINGNVITADPSTWAISITGSGCPAAGCTDPTAVTAEGTYSQLDLDPGTYTCTATTTDDASSGYSAAPQPTYNNGLTISADASSISGSCTVVANTVTDFVTQWKSLTDCAQSTTAGTVPFTVTDPTGAVLANMTVTMTNLTDGTKVYSGKTGAGGTISIKPPANWYTYTVTDTAGNYQTAQTSYGPVCVVANTTMSPGISVQMNSVTGCVSTPKSSATLTFTVTDASGSPALSGFKVSVTNTATNTVTAFPNTSPSGVSSKSMPGGPYTYTVSPPSGSAYQGSGLLGPICLVAGSPQNVPVGLSTQSCTRDTGHKGWLAFHVIDQTNSPISGATIKLINVNGDAVPAPVTTGSDGKVNNATKSIQAVVDPYQYIVTGPNGNYLSSGTLGPVCTTNNVTFTVPDVVLTGLMNVVVTVQNNDVLPWKTYQVSVTDPNSGNVTTQTVTVPNCTPGSSGCTRNPSADITFSGLVTGNGWYVAVCAVLKNNCNLVDSAAFNFTTPLATYSPPSTPDLAMVDASGGA